MPRPSPGTTRSSQPGLANSHRSPIPGGHPIIFLEIFGYLACNQAHRDSREGTPDLAGQGEPGDRDSGSGKTGGRGIFFENRVKNSGYSPAEGGNDRKYSCMPGAEHTGG